MIDLIEISDKSISEDTAVQVATQNRLTENSRGDLVYYDNHNRKQFDGYYLKVEQNKISVNVSLHKLFNKAILGKQTNHTLFTMSNAKTALEMLEIQTRTSLKTANVTSYEIGLNIELSKDCREYLDKIISIGAQTDSKEFFINARVKDKRMKTTLNHRHIRRYYKVYDKYNEMHDKRQSTPEHGNILRIETVVRRVEKMTVEQFFSPDNIKRITEQFFRDWRTMQFNKLIIAPKGTGAKKTDLCKRILEVGKEQVLKQARTGHKSGELSDKGFRTIREFIQNEWDTLKGSVKVQQSPEELEFREVFNRAYKIAMC